MYWGCSRVACTRLGADDDEIFVGVTMDRENRVTHGRCWGVVVASLAGAFMGSSSLAAVEIAPAVATSPCGNSPPYNPCISYTCTTDGWTPHYRADGTVCNDNNACTFGDACQSGRCTGSQITCVAEGPCESRACNGTSTCTVTRLAAGTACPVVTDNPCAAVCDGASPQCQPQ